MGGRQGGRVDDHQGAGVTGALALYAGINAALFLSFRSVEKDPLKRLGMLFALHLVVVSGAVSGLVATVGRRSK